MTFLKNILNTTSAFFVISFMLLGWASLASSGIIANAQGTDNRTTGPIYSERCANIVVGVVVNPPPAEKEKANCIESSKAGEFNSNTTSSTSSSCGSSGAVLSFQILPFCNIFELFQAITDFLLKLALPLALLVITWGGYQYFIGGLDGKGNGLKAIQSGVIGLVIVLTSDLIIKVTRGTFNENGLSTDAIINSILSPAVGTLVTLASGVALLVITWGGYKYFLGGIDGKTEGMKNIQSGITGLVVVLMANFLVQAVNSVFKGANAETNFGEKAKNFIEPILSQGIVFLTSLASVVAVLVIVWGGYKFFFSTLPGSKEDGKKSIELGITGLVVVIIAQPIVTIINSTIGVQNSQLKLDPQSLIYTAQVIITKFLIPISSVVTVGLFIWAGYLWITSQGDAGTVKKAKDSFFNAIIGLIVILLAVTITQLVVFFVKTDAVVQPNTPTSSTTSGTKTPDTIKLPSSIPVKPSLGIGTTPTPVKK